ANNVAFAIDGQRRALAIQFVLEQLALAGLRLLVDVLVKQAAGISLLLCGARDGQRQSGQQQCGGKREKGPASGTG
ncbi:MAG: hypothetical protein RR326_15395, partial [Stenotrophomonas sp.]